MTWEASIAEVRPHVVRIETPTGYGTGFLTFYNDDGTTCGIATAAHVVSHADQWQQPIRISNHQLQLSRFLKAEDRIIFLDYSTDSAVVLFFKGDLELPKIPITLTPVDKPCAIGADIGWLGFPNIEMNTLCFFSGTVSAHNAGSKYYLVDGVAINGVSGGPVFHMPDPKTVQIIGIVAAYHANRATGETLPGLLRAQDVSHFDAVAKTVKSMDEGIAKKREFEAAQAQKLADETTLEAASSEKGAEAETTA